MAEPSRKFTASLAGAGVFAALAALLTLARMEIPFPFIPYLKVDFAEIPVLVAFFLFGPTAATMTAVVQWLFLNVQGSDAPLGPFIKFAAIMSTFMGFWVGNEFYRRVRGSKARPNVALSIIFLSSILTRILTMSIVNYAVLIYVAPVFFGSDYLGFARLTLERSTGWQLADEGSVLNLTLLLTALYNLVNLLVAAVPAALIVAPITSSFKHITSMDAWLSRNLRS